MKIKKLIEKYKYQFLIFISFIISLFFNALVVQDYDGIKKFSGFELFLSGFFAFFGGGLLETFIWLANPLALCSLLLSKNHPKIGILLAMISFGIAISFTSFSEILVSENGRNGEIIQIDTSYWIWILSIILLIIYNIWNLIKILKQKKIS